MKYRAYCFDGANRVWVAEWFEASSDEQAVAIAREKHAGIRCELWEGRRCVAALDDRPGAKSTVSFADEPFRISVGASARPE